MDSLQKKLFELQDVEYGNFHSRLMPGIPRENIIGIRTPVLRKFASDFAKTAEAEPFMDELPHRYYEENNLHMMLIGKIRDFDHCICGLEKFLPYVNNWATCDLPEPSCLQNNSDRLLPYIQKWINSSHTYTIRYAVGLLMKIYLEDNFKTEYVDMVANVQSDEYYVNMMLAWYMATALAKQWDAVMPYMEQGLLPKWVHNKTIRKAIESYRITDAQKKYLKSLKKT